MSRQKMHLTFLILQKKLLTSLPWYLQKKSIILRALICWSISLLLLSVDERHSFDLRLQLRGEQATSEKISIFESPFKESEISRNSQIIKSLLSLSPEKLIILSNSSSKNEPWSLANNNSNKLHFVQIQKLEQKAPSTDKKQNKKYSVFNWLYEADFAVRQFQPYRGSLPDAIESHSSAILQSSQIINYLGPSGTIQTVSHEALKGNSGINNDFNEKIIIFQPSDVKGIKVNTPVGVLSPGELFAQVLEINQQRLWIKKFSDYWYVAILLLVLLIAIDLIFRYPQTVTFILFLWMGTFLAVFSIWLFDTLNIWLPVFSPLVLMFSVFVIFTSFQLAIQERNQWRMIREKKAAQEIELLKNNFLSLFSHDLKTPIAKIQAIIDRLLMTDSALGSSNDLQSIRRSSDELHQYIQKILQISRVESRQIKLEKSIADLNQIAKKSISRIFPLAAEKSISITSNFSPLFSVEIDQSLIEEVILNLLENAIKYSPNNSQITLTTHENEDFILLTVSDQGRGISKNEQRNIWNKFNRGQSLDNASKGFGFGLGLYLAKYFIELHDGHIDLKSQIDIGTDITFYLPIESTHSSIREVKNA